MDSVRLRLDRDQPLSFLEFNYMLLQSDDFLELHRRHGVALQMGGSDQWGNIVMGADLVRRGHAAEAFGLTTPLLTTASGAKMGKTAAGAVWLNPRCWRPTTTGSSGATPRTATWRASSPVHRPADGRGRRLGALPGPRSTRRRSGWRPRRPRCCTAATRPRRRPRRRRRAFEQGEAAATLPSLVHVLPAPVADLLVAAKLVASKGEARRLVAQNGVRLNDAPVVDPQQVVGLADLHDGAAKLSLGRKRHVLVRAG